VPWSEATRSALYGHGGFYHRPEGPAGHFRTSAHASPLFARAVLVLLERVDAALGHPGRLDLVDVGAGRGELLVDVAARIGAGEGGGLAERIRLHGVDLAERPGALPEAIGWSSEVPEHLVGLVVANEWLDNVPVDVVEAGPDGTRRVLVDPATGDESPGGPIGLRDAAWLTRWWPLDGAPEGSRAEVGFSRDVAWAGVVRCLDRGLAVAVDYGHRLGDRTHGTYAAGTLAGYRDGRRVRPVPDGSCDITAHVALDACAAAGEAEGATWTGLLRQREALGDLGLAEPTGTRAQLEHRSQLAELTDPHGLGAFTWLVQPVGLNGWPTMTAADAAPGPATR
jgi:SAM-dependent MidA family methyltransferase